LLSSAEFRSPMLESAVHTGP